MVNERKDFIELGTLTMDELAGVVHLYPWFASARKELCRRMSRLGGDDWGEEQYAEEALYIGDRRKVAELVRSGRKADYADKDVEKILRSYIAPARRPKGSRSARSMSWAETISPRHSTRTWAARTTTSSRVSR